MLAIQCVFRVKRNVLPREIVWLFDVVWTTKEEKKTKIDIIDTAG